MVGRYKVITLCGSTRFKDEFMEVQKRLTLAGNIVISVGLFGHSGDDEVWEGMDEGTITRTKEMLDDMHKRKIDMADEIFVINVDGYIGSSTRSEIEYAESAGKTVRYLEREKHCHIPDIRMDDAITVLKRRKKDIQRYIEIMQLSDEPMSPVFQRKFTAFYRVRRNEVWRSDYFNLMDTYRGKADVTFGEILLRLYQKSGQIEASFASKMLATLDPNMPIWDRNVLNYLGFHLTGKTRELKISNAVVLYDRICRWYKALLQTEDAKLLIARFDQAFPEFCSIGETKKVDFLIWANEQTKAQ